MIMPQLVGNLTNDLAMLAALVAADGVFDGSSVMLFENDIVVDRDTIRADLTDALYSGNGDEAITWGVPSVSDDGFAEVIGTAGEFRPNATTVGSTIFGAAIVSDTDALQKCANFDDPIEMRSTLDSIVLTVRL